MAAYSEQLKKALNSVEVVELAPKGFSRARAAFGLSNRVYRATMAHPHAFITQGDECEPLWPTLRTFGGAGGVI